MVDEVHPGRDRTGRALRDEPDGSLTDNVSGGAIVLTATCGCPSGHIVERDAFGYI
jgi:hypothetical protein